MTPVPNLAAMIATMTAAIAPLQIATFNIPSDGTGKAPDPPARSSKVRNSRARNFKGDGTGAMAIAPKPMTLRDRRDIGGMTVAGTIPGERITVAATIAEIITAETMAGERITVAVTIAAMAASGTASRARGVARDISGIIAGTILAGMTVVGEIIVEGAIAGTLTGAIAGMIGVVLGMGIGAVTVVAIAMASKGVRIGDLGIAAPLTTIPRAILRVISEAITKVTPRAIAGPLGIVNRIGGVRNLTANLADEIGGTDIFLTVIPAIAATLTGAIAGVAGPNRASSRAA